MSHTVELGKFPQDLSFVGAAEKAITDAGHAIVDMSYFVARDDKPAQYCQQRVRACGVYVGLIGFRYGSPVRDQANMSYTELEFEAATETGMPRLIFLLDESAEVPFQQFFDRQFGDRQEAFRRRLQSGNTIVSYFRSPADLRHSIYHALVDLKEQKRHEVEGSHLGAGGEGVPWMVPVPWESTISRPTLMDEIVRLLSRNVTQPVALTTALQGAGGFGKTTLAAEVCREQNIWKRFPGGLLWVTIGEKAAGPDLAAKVNDLSLALSGQRPTFSDPEQAGFHLGQLLGQEPRLLVVDDVWRISQLRPFLQGGEGCRRLITTRNQDVVPDYAATVSVDAMEESEARQLLTTFLEDTLDYRVDSILRLTGRWPVLLRLVNRALRQYIRSGSTVKQALDRIERRLRDVGPAALDVTNPDQRNQAVTATVEASLECLSPSHLTRYLELAVFPEDVDIPKSVLDTYWRATAEVDESSVDQLCMELAGLSLVMHYGQSPPVLRLHDVIRAYLRHRGSSELTTMNDSLLEAFRCTLVDAESSEITPWWRLPKANDYLWSELGYHLIQSGRVDELTKLLHDLRYITTKIRLRGPVAVDADLALVADPVTVALRRAVGQAAHLLTPIDPDHALTETLLSRLYDVKPIKPLISSFERTIDFPRLTTRWSLPDYPDPALRRTLTGHTSWVRACAISPDGSWLLTTSIDGIAMISDVATGRTNRRMKVHTGAVCTCAIGPDGRWLATAGDDRVVRIWDVATGEVLQQMEGHSGPVWTCAAGPDGTWLATAGDDRVVRIWDVATGEVLQQMETEVGWVYACAVSPDGSWLATAGGDRVVRIWDVATGHLQQQLKGHIGPVCACAVSPDGRWLATADGYDGVVHIWDVATGETFEQLFGHVGRVDACAFSPNGTRIATAGLDRVVRIWDVPTSPTRGKLNSDLAGHTGAVCACSVGPSSAWLVTTDVDGGVLIWEVATGEVRVKLEGHAGAVLACAVCPDGTWLATAGGDRVVRIWDVATGQTRQQLHGHTGAVRTCAVSPDGTWLATAGHDRVVRIWDVATGQTRQQLHGHTAWIRACAVSPDGTWLATVGHELIVRIWDVATGQIRQELHGHTAWLLTCAISPDGSWLATAGDDSVIRIWDVATGNTRQELHGHTGDVRTCAISSDARWLATAGGDQVVRIWDVTTGICKTAIRVQDVLSGCQWFALGLDLCVVGDGGVYVLTYNPSNHGASL